MGKYGGGWVNYYFYENFINNGMSQFVGNIEAKLDSKNRVFVPVAFRKTLISDSIATIIIRKDLYQPCLVIYPEYVWNKELSFLKQKINRWNKTQHQLLRQFAVGAERVELDTNGRILIPKRYIDMLGLGNEVTFIGVDDTIEIWDKKTLEDSLLASEDLGAMLEEIMNAQSE